MFSLGYSIAKTGPLHCCYLRRFIEGTKYSLFLLVWEAHFLGFGLWALGFGLWALGFGLWALGFGLWALGFGLWALGF
jgi:hypothetical protein